MKKGSTLILNMALMSLLGIWSCGGNSDDPKPPDPPTAANITGSVNLYDEGIIEVDNSGMKIIVVGGTPEISANTDADGKFTLNDVPFGDYSIKYEKTGYGTYRIFGVDHKDTGGPTDITEIPSLGQVSTTKVTDLTVSVSGDEATIPTTTDPAGNSGNTRYLRYFFHTDNTVSNITYTTVSETFEAKINPSNHKVSKSDLNDMGFASGSTVFVKAYGESFYSNDYEDPDSDNMIFPNLNENSADAVSFVVP